MSNTDIYVVYVTCFTTVEHLYSFKTLKSANAARLKLLHKWVNEDTFNTYKTDNNIVNVTQDTFDNYFMETEDDSYVGIDCIVLND